MLTAIGFRLTRLYEPCTVPQIWYAFAGNLLDRSYATWRYVTALAAL
jgi:hypothetical protein